VWLKVVVDTAIVYGKWLKVIFKSFVIKTRKTAQNPEKTLFILASHLPPNHSGGVHRPLSFIVNAKNSGWHCLAFCFDYPADDKQAGEYLAKKIDKDIIVDHISLSKLRPSWRMAPHIDGGFANSLRMFQSIVKKGYDRPDIILASGPQFNTFLAAYYLSYFFKTKLILDYRDEWLLCPFSWVEKAPTDYFFENMVCKKASLIIFTTKSHAQAHALRFPNVDSAKRTVISNGYAEEDLAYVLNQGKIYSITANQRFTISYLGALGEHSAPDKFLANLREILDECPDLAGQLQINFVGSKSLEILEVLENFKYQDAISISPHVNKAAALEIMFNSDALLILAAAGMKSYIPGKLFDYLSIKKPVVYYGEIGEASAIIAKLNAGFSVEIGDKEALKQALLALLHNQLKVDEHMIDDWLVDYTRNNLAKKLFEKLNTLL